MTSVRVAAVSLNQTPLDWDANRDNILAAIAEARAAGASVLCTPELSLTGYGCEDAFLWPATREMALEVLSEILPHTRGMVVSIGLPVQVEASLFNGAALLVDGKLLGINLKQHLAGAGLHYEPRWFSPWREGQREEIEFLGRKVPVGDLLFNIGGISIGCEICEDAWVEARRGYALAKAGAQIILGPSASHFSFSKHVRRRQLVVELVESCAVTYLYSNLLGNEAGRAIYDGDAVICASVQAKAQIVACARRFSFAARSLACATVALSGSAEVTARSLSLKSGASPHIVRTTFSLSIGASRSPLSQGTPGADEQGEISKEAALARVLALGLFDYLRKSRLQSFVISLSGGADSAAVAVLVWLMIRLGVLELGLEGFQKRIWRESIGTAPEEFSSIEVLTKQMLLTVYQSTANSSGRTKAAASALAQALGGEHYEIDVEGVVSRYRDFAESMMDRKLSWEVDDIALQNIQARARAPSVWMLANVRSALLLSTSNRSEAAVGYATMDGDTAGGLCPLGGIDKAFLRKWLIFMEKHGLSESGPIAALGGVNCQQPTAELRPASEAQSDEADLMPYEVLDLIERAAIVERLSPRLVLKSLEEKFGDEEREQLVLWVRRFYRLFSANQWKRERYAPSFHVDDANLDPKTWCRFPILSGGFRRELAELED